MFNWSPQFYSHPFCSLCELQLILWQILLLKKTVFNSYPNMNWKWNCKAENIQIFLSEIILAGENGSQGHDFGKILNLLRAFAIVHCLIVGVMIHALAFAGHFGLDQAWRLPAKDWDWGNHSKRRWDQPMAIAITQFSLEGSDWLTRSVWDSPESSLRSSTRSMRTSHSSGWSPIGEAYA